MIISVDKTIDFLKAVEEIKSAVPRAGRMSLNDFEFVVEPKDQTEFTHQEMQSIRQVLIAHEGDKIKKKREDLKEELAELRGIKDTESMSLIERIRRLEKIIAGEDAI